MINRHLINSLIITVNLIPAYVSADWVTDFVDRATVTTTQANYYEGNGRNFATLGGGSIRWASRNDYPVSITPPRLGGGCGGIDAYLGGVSFLDEEYLVQKIEAIITNAPAIAFDIAMKSMSSALDGSVKDFENLANNLNNLQLDDCAIAKKGVVTLMSDEGPGSSLSAAGKAMWGEVTSNWKIETGESKNHDAAKTNQNAQPVSDLFSGCGDPNFRDFIGTTGSLLDKMANNTIGLITFEDKEFLRANFGDIAISYDNSTGVEAGAGSYDYISDECGKNVDLEAAFNKYVNEGVYQTKGTLAANCTEDTSDAINNLLTSAIAKLSQNPAQTLTPRELSAVYMTGLPLGKAIRASQAEGKYPAVIGMINTFLPIFYSYNMFSQMGQQYLSALSRLKNYITQAKNGTDSTQCPAEPLQFLTSEINKAQKNIRLSLNDLTKGYSNKIKETGIDPFTFRHEIEKIINDAIYKKHKMMRASNR